MQIKIPRLTALKQELMASLGCSQIRALFPAAVSIAPIWCLNTLAFETGPKSNKFLHLDAMLSRLEYTLGKSVHADLHFRGILFLEW